ncbi:MAG TPA: hypothetical protein DDW30_03720 [Clostridiales bacterium]|nr:hypothetical protein [Clostridiales bacterium]
MQFIEFEKRIEEHSMWMNAPHSHEYYELYFLRKGERSLFVESAMFSVPENTFFAIPPYLLHKTEGRGYERININISPELLDAPQQAFLRQVGSCGLRMDNETGGLIFRLLDKGVELQLRNASDRQENQLILAKAILLLLSEQTAAPLHAVSAVTAGKQETDVLKIVFYLNTHFREPLSLETLSREYFLSKATLCGKFRRVMHCSIMEYVAGLRLTKAKQLLRYSDKSVEEIAEECGYSSPNYFGLIFKKEVGLSPLNFRKSR